MALVPQSVWPRKAAYVAARRAPPAAPVAPPSPPEEDRGPPAYGRAAPAPCAPAPCPPAGPARRRGLPAPPPEGLAVRKKLSDAYELWRACLSAGCRRAGRCQGDLGCACLAEQRDRVDFDALGRSLREGVRSGEAEAPPPPAAPPRRGRKSAARRRAQRYSSSLPSHL